VVVLCMATLRCRHLYLCNLRRTLSDYGVAFVKRTADERHNNTLRRRAHSAVT